MKIRFDDSLAEFVSFVFSRFGAHALESSVFIRDANGRLAVVIGEEITNDAIEAASAEIINLLSGYARDEAPIRDRNGPGSQRILEEGTSTRKIPCRGRNVRLLDRRMVGADWLQLETHPGTIPRIAFTSLKGGVGRSTALAVVAAYLSARGRRVLAVDLDLEAPGIGTMLLRADAFPRFGTLDYLVENGISRIDSQFLADCVGRSYLGRSGAQVSVLPAIGTATIQNAGSALSKIARAYLDDFTEESEAKTFSDQVREMLNRFESTGEYDVVLIDGRSGLHETTAAVILGIGAEVLLFGIDEPQTFLGYKLLFSHLALHSRSSDSWRARLQLVHAKATADTVQQADSDDRFIALFDAWEDDWTSVSELEPDRSPGRFTADDFEVGWDEDAEIDLSDVVSESTTIVHVLDDSMYREFNPWSNAALLTGALYERTFKELISWIDDTIVGLQDVYVD